MENPPDLPQAELPEKPTNPRTLSGMRVSEFSGTHQSDMLLHIADFLDEDVERFVEMISFTYYEDEAKMTAVVAHTERALEDQLREPLPRFKPEEG